MAHTACLSLGSNLGDREANLRSALHSLSRLGKVMVSSFYETEPVEIESQPWFLNCAACVEFYGEAGSTPEKLLVEILEIERRMGRRRMQNKGPRPIDIDILLFGQEMVDTPVLTVPHPAMGQRGFVLVPLAEIAPAAMHPGLNKTVSEMLQELPPGPVVRRL